MASRTTNPIPGSGKLQQRHAPAQIEVMSEEAFHRVISLERRRSERSQRPFVLLLIHTGHQGPNETSQNLLDLLSALQRATRETDVTGWYEKNSVVGVLFTEIVLDNNLVLSTILERISAVLGSELDREQFSCLKFSFHVFPENWNLQDDERPPDLTLYPDLEKHHKANRAGRTAKRIIDILGSLMLLLLLSPVFFVIAVAIKLNSSGPVFFRQKRIGRYGIPFTFWKFRSMYANNDSSEHQKYVLQLIGGSAEKKPADGNGSGIFKLTGDARITPIGKLLRRSSLDELPQLINVLRGEMSLVGPRPPIPYEVEAYATWHLRRLMEAKPGMTGLWQVHGRSRVDFDDMVRLDLRYARTSSPLVDFKILLQTPKAVIGGDGAC